MPFGQMRTEFVEGTGPMVEGKLVEGTVVEGTVVDGTTVVDGNTVLDGEMLGAEPAMLLPELALLLPELAPLLSGLALLLILGAGPTVPPKELGDVPTSPRVGVTPVGGVVNPLGGVPGAPGAGALGAATWADAGRARSIAAIMGIRRV